MLKGHYDDQGILLVMCTEVGRDTNPRLLQWEKGTAPPYQTQEISGAPATAPAGWTGGRLVASISSRFLIMKQRTELEGI